MPARRRSRLIRRWAVVQVVTPAVGARGVVARRTSSAGAALRLVPSVGDGKRPQTRRRVAEQHLGAGRGPHVWSRSTPNSRAKNTGSGVPRDCAVDALQARRRRVAGRAGRAGRRQSSSGTPARPSRPRSRAAARPPWPRPRRRRLIVSSDRRRRARRRRPERAGVGGVLRLRARHPQRPEVDRQRREGQQPHHRHRHVHQHRAALAARGRHAALTPRMATSDGAADGVAGGHGVERGRGAAALGLASGCAAPAASAAGGGASSSPVGAGRKRLRPRRQRRHFVGIERPHQARRDQHHQLGPLGALRLALEQDADDRQLAQDRDGRLVLLRHVVQQAGDGERLAVAQLDVGLGAPRQERRNAEALRA